MNDCKTYECVRKKGRLGLLAAGLFLQEEKFKTARAALYMRVYVYNILISIFLAIKPDNVSGIKNVWIKTGC